MDYSKMRWIGAIVPGMIAWTFETLRHLYFERAMGGAVGNVATFALVTLVTYLILDRVFQAMESVGERLSREQNRSALLKERDRIAREMHDGLSQALFFLNTKLSSIEKDLAKNEIESARRQLAEAQLATQRGVHPCQADDLRPEGVGGRRLAVRAGARPVCGRFPG